MHSQTVQNTPGFRRYLSVNSAATAFNATLGSAGDGLISGTALTTLVTTHPIFPMGKSLLSQFLFFGEGADGDTFGYRIWGVWRLSAFDGTLDSTILVRNLGGGIVTLGNYTVPSTITAIPYVGATTRFADTLAWTASAVAGTPEGPLATATNGWETAFNEGTSQPYTPASDLIAGLVLPCMGRCTGLIIDFDCDLGGGVPAESANALVMTDAI